MSGPPITVLIADDHPVVRSGIRSMLEEAPDVTVVGEASGGEEAIALVQSLRPDVLLLDMEMGTLSGVEVARRLQGSGSPVRILALSAYTSEHYIFGLLAAGAAGYLTKAEAPRVILDAVRGVARGEEGWLSRKAMAQVMRRSRGGDEPDAEGSGPRLDTLSDRERQVLRLIAAGHPNDEIAATIHIAVGTVKNHVTNIYSKLGVRSRAEAVALAWQSGLMDD